MKTFKDFLGEGYTLKKSSVEKYNEPQGDDYTDDINGKQTSYDIIHNKTGEKIGTAHHDRNDYFGPSERLRIKLHSGIDRDIATKGNPQSSFNHYVKKHGVEKLTPKSRK